MKKCRAKTLILDAQGVIFNDPFRAFLSDFGTLIGLPSDEVERRWDKEVRQLAWTGRVNDEELWSLLGNVNWSGARVLELLESKYKLGPAAPYLEQWSQSATLFVLSNHRSHWLIPRMKRFGIHHYFDKIMISDTLGRMKPDKVLFEDLIEVIGQSENSIFVDDQVQNVEVAISFGFKAIHAERSFNWIGMINKALDLAD